MGKDDIGQFLEKLGMRDENNLWEQIIRPSTVAIILGRKGRGKSALAYWLAEENAKRLGLLPVVINLPRERQHLLPPSFVIRQLEDMPRLSDAFIIIDEGTTMLPAGKAKLEELIKSYVALSRQRNQVIIFIFHASADAGSRILRGVDAILLKEPSLRQIQHGSKDSWWRELLVQAKEKFEDIADKGEDPRAFTFVDSEEPEFRGILENPLPSFWSDELSKAWAGVDALSYNLFSLGKPAVQALTIEELNIPNINATDSSNPFWYTVEELKQKCAERSLSIKGNKVDLVRRLFSSQLE